MVTKLTEHIRVNSSKVERGIEFHKFFPTFIWVLRDFYHELEEGHTPRDYMESCLEQVPGSTAEILSKNKIREGITQYFKDRDCYTLIRPLEDEDELAHIEEQEYKSLRPEFRKQMDHLVSKIYSKAKPKIINSKALNASMFLGLTIEYVQAINYEDTPVVTTALDRIIHAESQKTMERLYDDFQSSIDDKINRDSFPIEAEDLQEALTKIKDEYVNKIHQELSGILSVDEIIKNVNEFLDNFKNTMEQKEKENYTDSFLFNSSMLKNLIGHLPLDEMLDMKGLAEEDGKLLKFDLFPLENNTNALIVEFCNSMLSIIKEYQDNCKGPAKDDTLAEFIVDFGFVDEAMLVNDDGKIDFKAEKKYFSYVIEF